MPVFEYTGLTEAGKNVRGIRDAESSKVLRQMLRKDGVYLTDARAAESGAVMGEQKTGLSREVDLGAMLGFTGVSTQDLAIATRQLATLIAAGIPRDQAVAGHYKEDAALAIQESQDDSRQCHYSSGADDCRDESRRPNAVGAHVHRLLAAVGTCDQRLHRLGIFGTEIEDVPDLDATCGNLLVRGHNRIG